jgi:hypothetical protein
MFAAPARTKGKDYLRGKSQTPVGHVGHSLAPDWPPAVAKTDMSLQTDFDPHFGHLLPFWASLSETNLSNRSPQS